MLTDFGQIRKIYSQYNLNCDRIRKIYPQCNLYCDRIRKIYPQHKLYCDQIRKICYKYGYITSEMNDSNEKSTFYSVAINLNQRKSILEQCRSNPGVPLNN